jgi:hypothetical protein
VRLMHSPHAVLQNVVTPVEIRSLRKVCAITMFHVAIRSGADGLKL